MEPSPRRKLRLDSDDGDVVAPAAPSSAVDEALEAELRAFVTEVPTPAPPSGRGMRPRMPPIFPPPARGSGAPAVRVREVSEALTPRVSMRLPAEAFPEPRPASQAPAPAAEAAGADPLVGRVLGGDKYVLGELLAQGGVGRVYRGHHVMLDTPVAIKVLREIRGRAPSDNRRFFREARAANKMDHPNAVRVLDFGKEPDGLLYIVMELLSGESLRRILVAERRLSVDRIVDYMSQVCAALSVAHDQGIVHRDIKPENIVVTQRCNDDGATVDVVKLCDFGLAWLRSPTKTSGENTPLTAEGAVCGTPKYLSPEQAVGEPVDARTDIYSCGVLLYEMATGAPPFLNTSPVAILIAHVSVAPKPPSLVEPSVDPGLERVILRALSKSPAQRHQSARELRADLQSLVPRAPGTLTSMPPRSAERPTERPASRQVSLEPAPISARGDALRAVPPPPLLPSIQAPNLEADLEDDEEPGERCGVWPASGAVSDLLRKKQR